VRLSTRMSMILVGVAVGLGAAFPVMAWGSSEEPQPPAKRHECKKHKKQKCKKHDKQKCKKHGHHGDTKPDHEPKPPPPPEQRVKCNAGNGNGSDAVSFVEGEHCYGGDPGNSFQAGNRGGDEIPTTVPQGGVPNPGGNSNPG
jgi:hypothetical protein